MAYIKGMRAKVLISLTWIAIAINLLPLALLIFPAPNMWCWRIAVGVSEFSLWLAGISAGCIAGALLAFKAGQTGRAVKLALVISVMMFLCFAAPSVCAGMFAVQHGIKLSLLQYFVGAARSVCTRSSGIEFAKIGNSSLMLDVYRPAPEMKNRPAIIVIHGGAWSRGKRSEFPLYDEWLASEGYVVFDVDYRLANQKNHFPTQLNDIQTAVTWVQKHAQDYGVDKTRLALLGRSAGGQLALVAAYNGTPGARQSSVSGANARTTGGTELSSIPEANSIDGVRCVVALYAPTDMIWDYDNPAQPDIIEDKAVLQNFIGGTPATAAALYKSASPVDQKSLIPTLLIHGGRDQLVLQQNMYRMQAQLEAAHVPYETLSLPWVNHGFDFAFNGWGGQISRQSMSKFLKTYL
jgi:acetyl esterase/lipase